jgi:hypothetical protein
MTWNDKTEDEDGNTIPDLADDADLAAIRAKLKELLKFLIDAHENHTWDR